MDMVLSELKTIRESLHELRDDMHGKWSELSTTVAEHGQWITSHEKTDTDDHLLIKENSAKVELLTAQYNETRGAVRLLKLIIAGAAALLAILQAFLFGGHR